jgi:hypothetical protein
MRTKLFVFISSTTLIIFLAFGCKKSDQSQLIKNDQKEQLRNVNKQLIKEAQDWFNKRKGSPEGMTARKTHFGKFTPQWDSSSTFEDLKFEIVECPVRFDYQPGFNMYQETQSKDGLSPEAITKLIVLKNKKTDSTFAVFMNVVSSNDKVSDISYKSKNSTFTGYVFFTTLIGEFINGWKYEGGKITAQSTVSTATPLSKMQAPGEREVCYTVTTNWYYRDCIEYYNGTTTCGSWNYIETTYETYCYTTGSGGGGVTEDYEEDEVITFIDYDNPDFTISDGPEVEDPNTHIVKKQRGYNWGLITFEQRGSLGATYTWKYYSLETGNLEKANPNANWKFTNLVHNDISIVGSTRPDYVVSHQLSRAIPSYINNMSSAAMNITFSVSCVAAPPGAGPSYYRTVDKTSDYWIAQ